MSYHPQSQNIESQSINKKRKRISHETEELAWTAARCNRLLRSITSRIAAIRKLADSNISGQSAKPKRTVAKRVASHWSTQDPAWMGDAKRKTGAKTFAGRKKPSKQEATRDPTKIALITFPSPFVRRVCNREIASPAGPFVRPLPPQARLTRRLPIKPDSSGTEAETGLVLGFSSMLAVSNGQEPPKPRGARSLMSTCLKNVPRYIALLEEDEKDEDIDTSSEILDYLENLGTRESGGWSGLREVVRSQAMYAVCEAIDDGVLSAATIQQLVERCGLQESTAEGLEILTAWIEAQESVTAKEVGTLTTFGKEQNCVASTIRLMRIAGERNPVRFEGFCKTPGFWNTLLHSLSRNSSSEAEIYLSACLRHHLDRGDACLNGPGLSLKETIIRLTTMAASAMLLSTQTGKGDLSNIVHRTAASVVFSDSGYQLVELGQLLISCSLVLLGISHGSCETLNMTDLSQMLLLSSTSRPHRSGFAEEIVSSMVTLEQHLQSDLTGLLLERMVEKASVVPLYKQIALAAITAKQQSGENDGDDQALYAGYISRISSGASNNTHNIPQTPFRKHPKNQFRWEEGICEWVAKTPFTAATIALPTPLSIPKVAPESDDKENHDPPEEEVCASIKKQQCLLQNSPDVLAPTPRQRTAAESPLRPRQAKRKRLSHPKTTPRKSEEKRRAGRLSSRSCVDESADELGF